MEDITWDNLGSVETLLDKYSHMSGNIFSLGVGTEDCLMDMLVERDFLEAYRQCTPLKAIVGKRAKASNRGDVQILNAKSLKKGSGREAQMLRALIEKPNVLQNKSQFFAQQNIYIDIFGYCPILKMRPVGLVDEITSIWNIPPWLFDITYTKDLIKQNSITGIYKEFFMLWNGERVTLDPKNLSFIFDDGIGTECDTNLTIPDSRLVGLGLPVSNIIAAYKSRNTLITKRGAMGILSNAGKDAAGTIPLNPEEKELLQGDFKKYGVVGQPYQVIITNAALAWQQMGFATKDLLLFEEIEDDINRLCDAYGWPVELIAQVSKGSFNSVDKKEATKTVYRDTIIPESESRMQQFTNAVVSVDANLIIVRDFSGVEVLQEDRKTMAEVDQAINAVQEKLWLNGMITKNMWLKALGMPEVQEGTDGYENFIVYYEKPEEPKAAPFT